MSTPTTDTELHDQLFEQLTIEEYLQVRRCLAEIEDEQPTMRSNPPVQVIDDDPQRMTIANWPANDGGPHQ